MKSLAWVSGASRGIGREIALALAAEGFVVALVARTEGDLKKVAQEIQSQGGKALPLPCDLSDGKAIQSALNHCSRSLGWPAVLVNNAGVGGPFHRTDEVSDEEWKAIFAANIDAVFRLTRAVLPEMKKSGFGRVINVSSVLGLFGGERSSTYSATKHALIGYTRSIAAEWGRYGITSNAVCPGYTNTEMLKGNPDQEMKRLLLQRVPANRFCEPQEVAKLVAFLSGPYAGYINGSVLTIDGGLSAHLSGALPEF